MSEEKLVIKVAKAIERQYHIENGGPCREIDGGPNDCWRSMLGFAKVAVRAMRKG